jgi:NAD(P)-dependent dehydrogenase (short-subunit alcohol dehydrogenase family)
MLRIDLTGKRALVAGVADDGGFGFAIAKALAEAGATVAVGTWPPALTIFQTMLNRGKLDASLTLADGDKFGFAKIYPLDAEYDRLDEVPAEVRESRRYRDCGDFTIHGVASQMATDFGGVDIVIHSLANGPEVKKPLTETSRKGYLAALSASAYSFVSMVQAFGPIMPRGGVVPVAVVPGQPARGAGLRRRHVVGQGRPRERHPHPGLRGRPSLGPPGQRDLGRALRVAGRVSDRLHRSDGRLQRAQLAADRAPGGRRRRPHRSVPGVAAGGRDHRHDDLRRHGLPRDGPGGRSRGRGAVGLTG